ncbi:glycosyltransferase family A protein [Daejeonella lutea]|nr:glycosyltransferase family A protein [Daejeonella lutea]
MNVLNGEPFIDYQLRSIYKHAHEIIIVEGAYKKFAFATNNGRSQDTTLSSIRSFPDPDRKIKLIVKDGFYEDRMEMCNEFMHHITGDVVWQIDADEFYHDHTHIYIKELFAADADLDTVSFNFIDVFGSLKLQTSGLEGTGLQDVKRVHRFAKGDIWINQRPPVLGNELGQIKPINKVIQGDELERSGHLMFNLTMLFEKQIQDKFLYYQAKEFTGPMYDWFDKSIRTFRDKFNMLNFAGHLTYLTVIKSKLPDICIQIQQDCIDKNTKYPFIPDSIHYEIVTSPVYNPAVRAAYEINTLPQKQWSLLKLALKVPVIAVDIFYTFDSSSTGFVFRVFLTKSLLSLKKIFAGWFRLLKKAIARPEAINNEI